MKKYFAVVLFTLITVVAFAQSNYEDVVYLKNGSIIRGIIIEQIPNKSIKIETADRNVFVYQMEDIAKLAKEPIINQEKNESSTNNSGLKSGYRGIIEMGYQIKVGNYGMDRFNLNIINGYQLNPNFSLGLGTGLRFYYHTYTYAWRPTSDYSKIIIPAVQVTQPRKGYSAAALIPVFADLRATISKNKVSPYLSLGVGYSFDARNNFEKIGFYLNTTLGISLKVSKNSAMLIGIGYEMQQMNFFSFDTPYQNNNYYPHQYNTYPYNIFTDNSGAMSFNIGFSF